MLDDFSYVTKDQAETSVLFELISARYEQRSLLITANQPFGQWDKIFPEPAIEPPPEGRQGRGRVAAGVQPLLVRRDGDRGTAGVRTDAGELLHAADVRPRVQELAHERTA